MPVRTLGNGCHTPPALPHTRSQQPHQSRRTRDRSRQAHDRSTDRRKDARACRKHSEGPTHHRRLELLKCRVICHLVEGVTRTVGQGHVPMLDLVSVFEFDGRRGTFPRCVAVRFASAVTTRAARRKRWRAECQNQNRREPRARASSDETKLQLCLRGLQSTLQTLPLMKPRT